MPKFIKTDRVGVSDDDGNTVYLRRKLDFGARLRITEASLKGESMIALYVQSILGWDGPDFKGIKCTPENIEKIDIDDPFWEKVGDKIAELNPNLQEASTNPLDSTTDGEASTAEGTSVLEGSST